VVGEQVELVQNEQRRAAAAAVAWRQNQRSVRPPKEKQRSQSPEPRGSDLSSEPPTRRPGSPQSCPERKQRRV